MNDVINDMANAIMNDTANDVSNDMVNKMMSDTANNKRTVWRMVW